MENNKNVKLYNMDNNSVRDLYSHTSSIIAFDVINREKESYGLASVDFNGIYQEWKNDNVVRKEQLWDCKNVPE